MTAIFQRGAACLATAVLLCLTACSHNGTDDPAAALVAWWKFDDGTGTTAADASRFANTATLQQGDWGRGHDGGALSMNGGNDSIVTVPLTDSLRATQEAITVMAWTYRTAEHNVAVLAHGYPTLFLGFHGPRFKWEVQGPHGKGAACYADPKYRAALNEWIHIAGTYDGWRIRLYANGEQICSHWYFGTIAMPEAPFTLSGYLDNGTQIVDEITGSLDDVRIYQRALTGEQIQAVYSATPRAR